MQNRDDQMIYEMYQQISESISKPSDISGIEMYMQYTGVDGSQYLVQALPDKLGALNNKVADGNGVRFVANKHFGSSKGGQWYAHELDDIQVIHKIADPVAAGGTADPTKDKPELADKGGKGAWNQWVQSAPSGVRSDLSRRITGWAADKLSFKKPKKQKPVTTALPGMGGGSAT